jgi:hypothetical protein
MLMRSMSAERWDTGQGSLHSHLAAFLVMAETDVCVEGRESMSSVRSQACCMPAPSFPGRMIQEGRETA